MPYDLPPRGDGRVSLPGNDCGKEIIVPFSLFDKNVLLNVIAWGPGLTGFALHVKTKNCVAWRVYSSPDTPDALPYQVHTVIIPDVVTESNLEDLKIVPRGTDKTFVEYVFTYKEVAEACNSLDTESD